MNSPNVLVLDDDQDICSLLSHLLTKKGYTVATAHRGATARELLTKQHFDLVLCDHRLPDTDGSAMLQFIRGNSPGTQVIIITGYSDVRLAVDLMRRGAFDYLAKPLYPDEILMRMEEALSAVKEQAAPETKEGRSTRPAGRTPAPSAEYVEGSGAYASTVARHVALVAPTDMTVLITGETGTGKEYVAKRIHQSSSRADKPFVAVDCGALPKDLAGSELFGHVKGAFTGAVGDKRGSFEQAHKGTLFLDEVGNLTYENQIRLLRVLQERKIKRIGDDRDIDVDVRILAATNEDLRQAVAEGRFREDLLHRIHEFIIHLLPLRERREDIPVFTRHFMQLANARLGRQVAEVDPPAMDLLMRHAWSGNLRELGNVIKRAVLLASGDRITVECLPTEVIAGVRVAPAAAMSPVGEDLRDIAHSAEREAILKALERNGFNKSRTADMLKIDRKTLYNKLKAFGIEV